MNIRMKSWVAGLLILFFVLAASNAEIMHLTAQDIESVDEIHIKNYSLFLLDKMRDVKYFHFKITE